MKTTIPAVALPYLLTRLWQYFSLRRKYQFGLLVMLMLFSALTEVISLAALLPFLGVLTTPELILKQPFIADLAFSLGITSASQLVLPLTVMFVFAAIIACATRIFLLWVSTRFINACGADLSIEAYRRTLYQPYQVHLARNSSEVISGLVNKVGGAVNVLSLLLTLVSSAVLLVAIMLTLIAIDPFIALLAAFILGISYVIVAWISRRQLHRNSECIAIKQTQVIKALQEGLGGIRDVLLDGTQAVYCDIYRQADLPLRRAQGNNAFIGQSPRYLMEAVGMVLIATLTYALSLQAGGIASALPVLGALALGAQRLLPALQLIYSAWAGIVGGQASLADAINLLRQPLPVELLQPATAPLILNKEIRFEAVRFRYASDGPWILDNLNLNIPKGARVGFVGSTGSGKSTTLDLLMGLLTPIEGELIVDDQPIKGARTRAWQQTIAHVPQTIYLADATLAENIAFGVPPDSIIMEKVHKAARQAQIADFIESTPEGYQAYVGERGIRLSGGQRQRIGIARALYKEASILIFDEATSALDNATEQSVMSAINCLDRNLTILIIAHRLTTVMRCDIIVELERGHVVAQGTYNELMQLSPSFRSMATLSP